MCFKYYSLLHINFWEKITHKKLHNIWCTKDWKSSHFWTQHSKHSQKRKEKKARKKRRKKASQFWTQHSRQQTQPSPNLVLISGHNTVASKDNQVKTVKEWQEGGRETPAVAASEEFELSSVWIFVTESKNAWTCYVFKTNTELSTAQTWHPETCATCNVKGGAKNKSRGKQKAASDLPSLSSDGRTSPGKTWMG